MPTVKTICFFSTMCGIINLASVEKVAILKTKLKSYDRPGDDTLS